MITKVLLLPLQITMFFNFSVLEKLVWPLELQLYSCNMVCFQPLIPGSTMVKILSHGSLQMLDMMFGLETTEDLHTLEIIPKLTQIKVQKHSLITVSMS